MEPLSSHTQEGRRIPAKILDLAHESAEGNDSRVPVLDQSETNEILQHFKAERHGARNKEDGYEVRRLAKVGATAIDFVTLDGQKTYEPHVHQKSDSTIYITQGFGFLILHEGNTEKEVRQPYKPGDIFRIYRGTFHGFATSCMSHFVSVNNPEILDPNTGEVDLQFERR